MLRTVRRRGQSPLCFNCLRLGRLAAAIEIRQGRLCGYQAHQRRSAAAGRVKAMS